MKLTIHLYRHESTYWWVDTFYDGSGTSKIVTLVEINKRICIVGKKCDSKLDTSCTIASLSHDLVHEILQDSPVSRGAPIYRSCDATRLVNKHGNISITSLNLCKEQNTTSLLYEFL